MHRALLTALLVVIAMLVLLPRMASTQEVAAPELGCTPSEETGVVQGRVINHKQVPVRRGVLLEGPTTCFVSSDSAGMFSFEHVPPGSYTVEVGSLTSAIFTPLPIAVAGDTTTLTLRLEAYDVVSDCRSMPRCAPLLDPRAEADLPENVDPLVEAGLRTGIGVAIARHYVHPEHVPCIVGATPHLLEALRQVAPAAVDASECEYQGERLRELLYHTQSERRAFRVSFNPTERSEEDALGDLSVGFGSLAGLGQQCSYRRTGAGWRLVSCRITWVS